ncbi:MerR family transcriptional regulator [Polymorphospora rubra]|uniref:MerR family transcriptional regulator n=1 Tax=Polymorphospora rubra TaxID=338584 RepID=A0A810N0X1_9ACTN|nr:MerR family transcriptional regulator [Polymorphospora rubra]BCJ66304.1 MerR family transcriptional regulator [Polymorphospora rubra]
MNIGELARRSGLSVKTVRYYSDLGLVPEVARTHSGHRRYDAQAAARLDLVRTLRELGLDLATIRQVLDRQADLTEVVARHAEAVDAQIRLLRVRRSVLRALARRRPTTQEVDRMNQIAQATADDRRRIIDEFLDSIFTGIPVDPDFEGMLRRVRPELPDDPTDAQLDAWLELSELVRDPDFRDLLRRMSEKSFGGDTPPVVPVEAEPAQAVADLVTELAGPAATDGVDPASAAAGRIIDRIVAAYAGSVGRVDDPGYRRELLDAWKLGADPRPAHYWQLMATVNGWPPYPAVSPVWAWAYQALAAHTG